MFNSILVKARCRGVSDILGDHAISCGIGGERIAWHNYVRDAVFQTAVQAAGCAGQ